jgi:DNA-binding beta-propeller fold protein YncE
MNKLCKGLLIATAATLLLGSPARAADPHYQLESEIKMPGVKIVWDYLAFDTANRKLYINRRANGVFVYSPDDNKMLGLIEKSEGSNGVALAYDVNRGYSSNDNGTSTVFDLKTQKTITTVKDGEDNDANVYDPFSKKIIWINADAGTATFGNAADGKILGKAPLNSKKPEFPAVDGKGKLFVNIQDKSEVAVFDTDTMKELARWSTAPCQLPTALVMDPASNRLFIGCRSDKPVLAVMDAASGKVVASLPIGRGTDAAAFDPETKKIFVTGGLDAKLTIIQQKSADEYAVVEEVATRLQARTIAIDPKTKKVFTVTAAFGPPGPDGRQQARPDSFALLIYAPK